MMNHNIKSGQILLTFPETPKKAWKQEKQRTRCRTASERWKPERDHHTTKSGGAKS